MPSRCSTPCSIRIWTSCSTECPNWRACARARASEMAMSPRGPVLAARKADVAGNDKTSVGASLPRNSWLSLRSSASPVMRQSKVRPFATAVWIFRANRSMGPLFKLSGTRRNVTLLPSGDIRVNSGLGRSLDRRLRLGIAVAVAAAIFRSGLGQLERELSAGADRIVISLVCLDDALHERVPHHVALIELHEADALHALENFEGIDQPAAAGVRQIDLGDVAVHYHLGVEPLAREDHLHLLGGTVLCFVQNDEAVVEGAAAHERDRRHFDDVALEQFFHAIVLQHVIERVVERA